MWGCSVIFICQGFPKAMPGHTSVPQHPVRGKCSLLPFGSLHLSQLLQLCLQLLLWGLLLLPPLLLHCPALPHPRQHLCCTPHAPSSMLCCGWVVRCSDGAALCSLTHPFHSSHSPWAGKRYCKGGHHISV